MREKALDKPYAILILCQYCNQYEVTDKRKWPQARQLAVLRRSRPADYDLVAFNALVNLNAPNRITECDITEWSLTDNDRPDRAPAAESPVA
jgi:hypothetical protein